MPTIHGNTTGLSPQATKALERIYRRRVPLEHIATPELIKSLAEASVLTGRQVGVLVHRSGEVDTVIVGDATRLMLPDIGRLRAAHGRFRALRLVHTHLYGEPLTRDDLVDLVRMRLDLVAAIQLHQGEPKSIHYAHNSPVHESALRSDKNGERAATMPYSAVGPIAIGRPLVHFGQLIQSLEDEFARRSRARPVVAKDGRAILVHVGLKNDRGAAIGAPSPWERADESLRELAELARTAGVEVVDTVLQLRDRIDPRLVLGKGKLDDVVLRAAEFDAETLIFDGELSPSQASAIGKLTDLRILDRTQLILDIFAQRAQERDGKLQVELAQLKYALPRLSQKDDSLSRLTGGIGGRGPGETKLEIGRRRAKERVASLEAELQRLGRRRVERRRRRERLDVPVVAIVGYTNAGKSTLLNSLTGSDVLAEDKLFATLDTRSRRLRFPEEREVVLTDTVGFIRELPKDLFAAFRATFEEAADSDLLLHVVDASDPAFEHHMSTTEALLGELDLLEIPRVLVFNKVDRLDPDEALRLRAHHPGSILVSATRRESTHALLDRMQSLLRDRWDGPPARGATPGVEALDELRAS